jgi:hypothetical protein
MALPLTVVAKTWIEEVLFKDVLDKWNYRPSPNRQIWVRKLRESRCRR